MINACNIRSFLFLWGKLVRVAKDQLPGNLHEAGAALVPSSSVLRTNLVVNPSRLQDIQTQSEIRGRMEGNLDANESEAGARVWVLYLPERPRRSDLYPLLFVNVAG
jgi:hypothetical protein